MFIRNNVAGVGRLLFVAGHGAGDVSDIYIQDNVLHDKNMGVDFVAPAGTRRQNIVVTGNRSDQGVGNGRGAVMRFVGYDYVHVWNNVQPAQRDRDMYMVGYQRSCEVTVSGNNIYNGAGQAKESQGTVRRLREHASAHAADPAEQFEGQNLKIDVGGNAAGMIPCSTETNCGGYYKGGATTVLTAASGGTLAERTSLLGNLKFAIPIRSGTYAVTLTYIEPVASIGERRFHLNMEGPVRVEVLFDVNRRAGGINRVVRRTYPVTVGDGVMDIEFLGESGQYAPILSLLEVDRL